MANTIFWDNQGIVDSWGLNSLMDGVKPHAVAAWTQSHCDIQEYTTGSLPTPFGNISQDPQFVDLLTWDVGLGGSSPCLDTGSVDFLLIDWRHSLSLLVDYEFDVSLPRVVDETPSQSCAPSPNVCGEVDMGARERQP
ncbi:MAG: hypothetical protein GY759_09540 [Chloroflexi bacterium]|nr:hypothetical protein [Chloroflexota bacterium]